MITLFAWISISAQCATQPQQRQALDAALSTPRTNVYQNETVTIVLAIRSTGLSIDQQIQVGNMPDADKLVTLEQFKSLPIKRREIDGQIIETRSFRGEFRPLINGSITISPTIRMTILTKQKSIIFGATVTRRNHHTLKVKPLTIFSRPVPTAGAPEQYENAIGNLSFDIKIEPADVAVGDLINIKSTVSGNGCIDDISPIGIDDTPFIRTYDSQIIEQTTESRTFNQTVVVLSTNATEIPALSFDYFDPTDSKYKTITRGPFPLMFHEEKRLDIEVFQPKDRNRIPHKTHKEAKDNSDTTNYALSARAGTMKFFNGKASAVLNRSDSIYLAPAQSAMPTAQIPSGAVVKVIEEHDAWIKVEYLNNRGWIRSESLSSTPYMP